MARWRIEASLIFPTHLPASPDGDLPERLEPTSKIRPTSGMVGNTRMLFRPSPIRSSDLRYEAASLIFLLEAEDPQTALTTVSPQLEATMESLSFQLLHPLEIWQLELIDVTAPVKVGDQRRNLLFPPPLGYKTTAFMPTMIMMGAVMAAFPDPTRRLDQADPRSAKALDWYLKALRASLQADHFMFLWIATEILSDGIKLTEPTPLNLECCGHVLAECPNCKTPTEKTVSGSRHQKYLREVFGLSAQDAKKAWRMRQMFHGAVSLDSDLINTLPTICRLLLSGLTRELNTRLRLPPGIGPSISPGGPSIAPAFQFGGLRSVAEWDVDGID